ncbi:MAG: cysteine desulfurase family protein [Planctomycetota bacterium]|nr:cysteine desulfurase family protein [Planctomycetota bacterium]
MIILDHNATTPVLPEILDAMMPYLKEEWGNPSSQHALGRNARAAVERAREQVASLIGAKHEEIIFTSGGTEATNLALAGTAGTSWPLVGRSGWRGTVSSVIEHPATLETLKRLRSTGHGFRLCRVTPEGQIDLTHMERLMFWRPRLVSVIHAHNETGTVQPVQEVGRIAHRAGALLHADASQSPGKIRVNVDEMGVDLLTIAGHKLYAPKGIGALYIRTGTKLFRQISGGGQERGYRGGTENVPYIVGLGAAAERASKLPGQNLVRLRDRLWEQLSSALGQDIQRFTHATSNLPNTLFVALRSINTTNLLQSLPALAASTGSACHDGKSHASAVLNALKVPTEWHAGTLRLSLGHSTTESEIDTASAWIIGAVKKQNQDSVSNNHEQRT